MIDPKGRSAGAGEDQASPVPAVELTGITKRFGNVVACDSVDLSLYSGQIHGVLGENGAGKSTLMKVLIGLVLADAGNISINGRQCHIVDPLEAARLGIGMVHQHFSLVEPMTVWENVALGEAGRLDPARVRERIGEISDRYGLAIDPYSRISDLSAGLRQRVEIIKCLRRDPSVMIFDEPTSVLTPEESEQLFESLRSVVTDEGRSVALVSHKLDEILRATDTVTIMRKGRVVDHMPTAGATAATLARAMVGRSVSLRSERAALGVTDVTIEGSSIGEGAEPGAKPVLEVRDAVVHHRDGHRLLDSLSLIVHPGEILGVAGVEGNGQQQLADLLSSLIKLDSGSVHAHGTEVATGKPGAMGRAGIAVIPAERHDSGVVLGMTVAENLLLMNPQRVSLHGIMYKDRMHQQAQELIDEFEIQCAGPEAPLWSLSGGNQQRVVLARELSHTPPILVAAQPTRGLDVGAIEYTSDRLRDAAGIGVAVLLISNELEEILDLSNRIVVLSAGRVIGAMDRADADLDRIGMLMGGAAA